MNKERAQRAFDGSEKKCHAHGPHPPNTLKGASAVNEFQRSFTRWTSWWAIAQGVVRELSFSRMAGHKGLKVVIGMTTFRHAVNGHMWSYGLHLFFLPCLRACSPRTALRVRYLSTSRALACERWIQISWWQLWSVCRVPRTSRLISKAPWPRICHSPVCGGSTYVGPFSWNATWSPQWCRAVWDW